MPEFSILGAKVTQPITADKLETFPAPKNLAQVVMETDEFTSVCPVTGQPDYSTVTIDYQPNILCLESKSLKLYLWQFREAGVFCESLAQRILNDLRTILDPIRISVTVTQKPRGGISITATAED